MIALFRHFIHAGPIKRGRSFSFSDCSAVDIFSWAMFRQVCKMLEILDLQKKARRRKTGQPIAAINQIPARFTSTAP